MMVFFGDVLVNSRTVEIDDKDLNETEKTKTQFSLNANIQGDENGNRA